MNKIHTIFAAHDMPLRLLAGLFVSCERDLHRLSLAIVRYGNRSVFMVNRGLRFLPSASMLLNRDNLKNREKLGENKRIGVKQHEAIKPPEIDYVEWVSRAYRAKETSCA